MTQVVLAVKHAFPDLQKRLEESMFFFHKNGYKVLLKEHVVDGWPHLSISLQGADGATTDSSEHLFRYHIAGALEQYILFCLAEPYLDDILAHHYFYFPRHERQEIINFAYKIREREKDCSEEKAINAEIHEQINMYLSKHDYLNIHGLIVFRLGSWLSYLRKCVDEAVDEFLIEKEYQEFIKLLKYFVQLQEPRIYQAHVTLDSEGNVIILDHNHNLIDVGQGEDWEVLSNDQEDMLVSSLITVAPQRIVLHKQIYTHYPKATDTLTHVFEKRVTLCKECKLCHDADTNMSLKGKL